MGSEGADLGGSLCNGTGSAGLHTVSHDSPQSHMNTKITRAWVRAADLLRVAHKSFGYHKIALKAVSSWI